MKNLILLPFLLLTATTSFSQEADKRKELSINLYNFNNFGFQYKVGNEKGLWRYRLVNGGINSYTRTIEETASNGGEFQQKTTDVNLEFSFGREKRKNIGTNLHFIYGAELLGTYRYINEERRRSDYNYQNIGAGLVGVVGLSYNLNERLFIGVELLPSIVANFDNSTFSNGTTETFSLDRIDIGMRGNSALISFGFSF